MNEMGKGRVEILGEEWFQHTTPQGAKGYLTSLCVPRTLSPTREFASRREVRMTKSDKSLTKKNKTREKQIQISLILFCLSLCLSRALILSDKCTPESTLWTPES